MSGRERALRERMLISKTWCRLCERELPAYKLLIIFVWFCLQNLVLSKVHTLQQSTGWAQVTVWWCGAFVREHLGLTPATLKISVGEPCSSSALSWLSHNFPLPPPPPQVRPSLCHPARALPRLLSLCLPCHAARLPLLLQIKSIILL